MSIRKIENNDINELYKYYRSKERVRKMLIRIAVLRDFDRLWRSVGFIYPCKRSFFRNLHEDKRCMSWQDWYEDWKALEAANSIPWVLASKSFHVLKENTWKMGTMP